VDRSDLPEGGIESASPGPRFDPWSYRDDVGVEATGRSLVGYKVEATDGSIGKVDTASHDVNSSYLVVDTGHWIFGKKVMIPAGTINHIDHSDERVYLDRTKEQVKTAPEWEDTEEYREKVASYYGDTYGLPGTGGGIFPPGAVPPGGMIPPR
jgi:hypothetical protein